MKVLKLRYKTRRKEIVQKLEDLWIYSQAEHEEDAHILAELCHVLHLLKYKKIKTTHSWRKEWDLKK